MNPEALLRAIRQFLSQNPEHPAADELKTALGALSSDAGGEEKESPGERQAKEAGPKEGALPDNAIAQMAKEVIKKRGRRRGGEAPSFR